MATVDAADAVQASPGPQVLITCPGDCCTAGRQRTTRSEKDNVSQRRPRPRRSRLARGGWAAVTAASVLFGGLFLRAPLRACVVWRHLELAIHARVAAGIDHEMALYTPYDRIRAILVKANGRTVFERYYRSTATESHNVASVTKSVMSTLVGIAVGEGKLRLDQPLAQLLPPYAATMTPAVAHATLRQVLTMTAGLAGPFNADDLGFATAPDWVRAILTHPARPPGGSFGYSSGGSHLLSAILVTATGQSVLDYARVKLFDPLGIPTRPALQPLFDRAQPRRLQHRRLRLAGRPATDDTSGSDSSNCVPGTWPRSAPSTSTAAAGKVDRFCPRPGSGTPPPPTCHRGRRNGQLRLPMVGQHRRRRPRLPRLGIRRSTHRSRATPPPRRRHLHLLRPERPQRPRRHPHRPDRPGRLGHRPRAALVDSPATCRNRLTRRRSIVCGVSCGGDR